MDGDGRIPYGGSLGCLPAPCCPVSASCPAPALLLLLPVRDLCGIPSAPASGMIAVSTSPHDSCMIAA